jgi:hypothetical protein
VNSTLCRVFIGPFWLYFTGGRKQSVGSRDVYLQAESPGADRKSNWLPIP